MEARTVLDVMPDAACKKERERERELMLVRPKSTQA
jgi:hypothetical protein